MKIYIAHIIRVSQDGFRVTSPISFWSRFHPLTGFIFFADNR